MKEFIIEYFDQGSSNRKIVRVGAGNANLARTRAKEEKGFNIIISKTYEAK